MLAYITLGFAAFAVALVVLTLYDMYRRTQNRAEGYDNVPHDLFVPKVTPGGNNEPSALSPGGAMDPSTEALVESAALPAMSREEARSNWGTMTSERCYRSDIGESLKKTRNFLQRTNNYPHVHPDSCSAPNHEFVGTFYTPFDGVGRNPAGGGNYPPSTFVCPE